MKEQSRRGWWVRRSRVAYWLNLKREAVRTRRAHLDYYARLYDPAYSGWVRFQEAVGAFQSRCREAEVPLVALVFPMLSWDLNRGDYPFRYVHEAIGRELKAHDVASIDLFSLFQGKASVRLEVIPRIDGHPNEIAHRIAADTLFRTLLEQGILDASYIPEHTMGQEAHWEEMRKKMQSVE